MASPGRFYLLFLQMEVFQLLCRRMEREERRVMQLSLRGGRGPNPVPAGKAGTILHHDGRQDAWAEAQLGMVGRIMAPQRCPHCHSQNL